MSIAPGKNTQKDWIKVAIVAGVVALCGAIANHYLSKMLGVDP